MPYATESEMNNSVYDDQPVININDNKMTMSKTPINLT